MRCRANMQVADDENRVAERLLWTWRNDRKVVIDLRHPKMGTLDQRKPCLEILREEVSMRARFAAILVSCLWAAFLGGGGSVRADDFYKGKTITIVVGSTPSGAFDIDSRALARHLGDHIPGHPAVIVQNMPGAGSVTAIRYIRSTAPKDGTAIGVFLPGIITQSVVTPEKIGVDFRDFLGWESSAPIFRVSAMATDRTASGRGMI